MPTLIDTCSEAETVAAGEAFGGTLGGGTVVLLEGQLGAGKTAFVRGMAAGAGAEPADVSSPTFTLIQEYAGRRVVLYHVDLYRLAPHEVPDLGLDELIDEGAVLAVEWPDRWRDQPASAVRVTIEETGEDGRRITIGDAA